VDLQLPKFTFDYSTSLNDALKSLGMTTAFSGSADLSGIPAKAEGLQVNDVVHKAHIAVTEDGTTAAAATGISVGASAVAPVHDPVVMHVDHPFLFFIRDTVSGQIVFAGQVTDPQS
jgi:serpin B